MAKLEKKNDDGNGLEQIQQMLNRPEFQKVMYNNEGNTQNELSKHALLKEISEDSKSDWFTQYRNYEEVLQMNDIETHARLIPLVFGQPYRNRNARMPFDIERTKKHLEKIRDEIFLPHTKDHMRNMSSYKATQLKALVTALRADSGYTNKDNPIKTIFGVR